MSHLRYTDSARNDLLEAWLYIAQDNPNAADRLLNTLSADAKRLQANPLLGRLRPELADNLRSWPTASPYILFYHSDPQGIVILRVLHHARDFAQIDHWS